MPFVDFARRVKRVMRVGPARLRCFAMNLKHRWARGLALAKWRLVLSWSVAVRPRMRVVSGVVRQDALPIVMCLWNRPSRIAEILRLLDSQEDCPPLRLLLWNNDPTHDAHYLDVLGDFESKGALASVEYRSSRFNLGGIARFVVARHECRSAPHAPFVMLDDDQEVSNSLVHDLLVAYSQETYAGCWAFRTHDAYWARDEVPHLGEATYVGTGGSVCDSSIVEDTSFFWRLPARYGFIEDLWASHVARSRGWRLVKVMTPMAFTLEERNQHHAMIELKNEFYAYLDSRDQRGYSG